MKKRRYPGVKPFSISESNLFFGRKRDIDRLFKLVNVKELVVLHSKSGLGKSSLINAGLLPRIHENTRYKPVTIRLGSYLEGQSPSPLNATKEKITSGPETPTLLDKLAEPDRSLWYHLKSEQLRAGAPQKHLLIFDQFEELFTYPRVQVLEFKKGLSEALYSSIPQYYQAALKNTRKRFSDEQLEQIHTPLHLTVLIAIRSDRFSLIDQLKDYIPDILTNTYHLSALSRAQAEEAILSPAYIEDPEFESPVFDYTDDAIDKILDFLSRDGSQDIESFQLQILCQYIEESIVIEQNDTYVEYHDVGDIGDIFETYYDKLISRLPAQTRSSVRRFLEEGLIFEEEERRLSLYEGQIIKKYGISRTLLQQLVGTHIIRAEPHTAGGFSYELSHDSLVKPVLRAYHKRREEEKRRQEELRHQKEYDEYKKKLNRKHQKILVTGVVVLLIIFGVGFFGQQAAEREAEIRRLAFLNSTTGWYESLVDNFDNDKDDPVHVRDPRESIALRTLALDIGLEYEQELNENNFQDIPVLKALRLAGLAFAEIGSDKVRSVQLAREALRIDRNKITEAVLTEAVQKGNFYKHKHENREEDLLSLAFDGEDKLIKVTSRMIGLISLNEGGEGRAAPADGTGTDTTETEFQDKRFTVPRHFAEISRNGKTIITIDTARQKIERWVNRDNGFEPAQFPEEQNIDFKKLSALTVSPDGRHVALGENSGRIHCWDLENNEDCSVDLRSDDLSGLENSTIQEDFNISQLVFSPDNRYLVVTAQNFFTIMYDMQRRLKAFRLENGEYVNSASFPDNGEYLLTALADTVTIWKGENSDWNSITRFPHREAVQYAAFSPDNRLILSRGVSGTFYMWDKDKLDRPVKMIKPEPAIQRKDSLEIRKEKRNASIDEKSNTGFDVPSITFKPVIFSNSGNVFATASSKTVYVWETSHTSFNADQDRVEQFFAAYQIPELEVEPGEDRLERARAHYDKGEFKLAIRTYENILETSQKDSTKIDVLNELGNSYYSMGENEQAISYYEKALDIDPGYHLAWENLGFVYYNLKEYEKSIENYEKALELNQDYAPSALNELGNNYYSQERYEQAIIYYKRAVEADPRYKWSWRNLGMSYFYMEKFDQAFDSFIRVYQIDPDFNIVWEWNELGIAYYDLKSYEKASDSYRRALAFDPDYQWAYYNLGLVEYARKNYSKSYGYYKRALEINPEFASAQEAMVNACEEALAADPSFFSKPGGDKWDFYCRGKVHFRKGRLQEAFNDYSQIYEKDKEFRMAAEWNELGIAFYNLKSYQKASDSYQRALDFDPGYQWAYNNLGLVEYARKNYTESYGYYKKALEINPGFISARNGMVNTCEEGLAADSSFFSKLEGDTWGLYCRGKVHYRNDRLQEAFNDYSQIYEKDKEFRMAADWNELGNAYFNTGNYKQAVTCQERAVLHDPGNAIFLWSLSWYYLFTKQFKEAVTASEKVLRMDSTQTGVYTNLALGYLLDGRYPDAEQVYKEWMDKEYPFDDRPTFREVFLDDLKELEQAGITHPGVERIRNVLRN